MQIEHILNHLERFIEQEHWAGWDPYDGLNSPVVRALTLQRKWLRIAAIQFMKRSPINVRTFFGVPKTKNPKAMGLLARAYVLRCKQTKKQEYVTRAKEILDWLISHNSPGYHGYAWGYNFDWQSSIFFIPKGIPTIVNTSYVGHAFLDAYKTLKERTYLEVARSACDFILKDLNRHYFSSSMTQLPNDQKSDRCFCFSYSPLDNTCVHNANLLGAELLARVYSITKEDGLLRAARSALEFAVSSQNLDGSWFYGQGARQRYVDSFHTGFVMVSMKNILDHLDYADNSRFRRILSKGYEYYKNTFFDDDGRPHYYSDKIYPIDLHCSAQGIITFLEFSAYDHDAINTAKKIANWAIQNMWDNKNGYFYFQKIKYFINKISYLRWPNAWMYYALVQLALR